MVALRKWLEDACEEIDGREELEEIRCYLGRWERRCKVIEEMLDEEDKENEK